MVKSSAYDNYQALMHSRKYQDDFRKYENHCAKVGKFDDIVVGNPYDGNLGTFRKGRSKVGKKEYPLLQVRSLSEAGRALCDRWNLYCPISPFQERSMAEIEGLLHWVSPPIQFLEPPEKWKKQTAIEVRGREGDSKIITEINGKLVLMIDTSFNADDLERLFRKMIGKIKRRAGATGRKGESSEDMWAIYRMHEIEGKPLLTIAQDLHGFTETPVYNSDPGAWSHYNRVRNAYRKAKRLVKQIEDAAAKLIP